MSSSEYRDKKEVTSTKPSSPKIHYLASPAASTSIIKCNTQTITVNLRGEPKPHMPICVHTSCSPHRPARGRTDQARFYALHVGSLNYYLLLLFVHKLLVTACTAESAQQTLSEMAGRLMVDNGFLSFYHVKRVKLRAMPMNVISVVCRGRGNSKKGHTGVGMPQ